MNKDLIINKSAFPFYVDYWQQYFSRLSGGQCKEVLRIVCQFNLSGEQEKHEDFGVDMVANSIITNVIRDAKKREKRILASRENGEKGGRPAKKNPRKPTGNPDKPTGFIKPTLEEVTLYCQERKNKVDAQSWIDHYTSNGWKVGKVTMKDWKAAVRKWERSNFDNKTNDSYSSRLTQDINAICGSNLVKETKETETEIKIICFSPTTKSKLFELPEEKKNQIKKLFGNKKFEFLC